MPTESAHKSKVAVKPEPVDWTMIEGERKLAKSECLDGKPGLSDSEFKELEASGDKEIHKLHARYKEKYKSVTVNLHGYRDLGSFFHYAVTNMNSAMKEIVASGNGSKYVLNDLNPASSSRNLKPSGSIVGFLGRYYFIASNKLSPEELGKLRKHIVHEFNRRGVHFAESEIAIEVDKVAGSKELVYTITFPPKKSCATANLV